MNSCIYRHRYHKFKSFHKYWSSSTEWNQSSQPLPRLKHLINSFSVQDSFCSTYSFYMCSTYVENRNLREEMHLESFKKRYILRSSRVSSPGSIVHMWLSWSFVIWWLWNEWLLVPNIRTSQRIPLSSYLWMENFASMKGYHWEVWYVLCLVIGFLWSHC